MVYFTIPSKEMRLELWKKAFPERFVLETEIDLQKIAHKYELSGGAIINIVRYCTLMTLSRSSHVIDLEDLMHGIRKEFLKEGKTVTV